MLKTMVAIAAASCDMRLGENDIRTRSSGSAARALSKNFGAPTQGVWMWAAPGPRAPPIACLEGRGTSGRAVKHNLGVLNVRFPTFNEKKMLFLQRN